jgi:hypothetical protein
MSKRSLTVFLITLFAFATLSFAETHSKIHQCAATATSSDGGKTWNLTNKPPVTGAIYGLSYVGGVGHSGDREGTDDNGRHAVVSTANTGGAAWTPDEGNTWFTLPGVSGFWAVAFASPKAGWLVGTGGTILKISF